MILEESNVHCVGLRSLAVCPLCEREGLKERHCKLVCEGCGYVESCEDNFAPSPAAPIHHHVRNP